MPPERTPQRGDEVLVSFKATVLDLDDHGRVGLLGGTYGTREWRSYVPETATVKVVEPGLCGASEGMTGIDCQLAKGHVAKTAGMRNVHEGTTTPEQTAYVGYEMFVRWPVVDGPLPARLEDADKDLCMLDDCVAAPRCSSGATVWHDRTAECGPQQYPGGVVGRAHQQRQQPRRRTFPYQVREWMDEEARVECFDGRDADHVVHEGVAIGLTEAPTVRVQKDDGQIVSWVIGLTRRAQTEEPSTPVEARKLIVHPHVWRSLESWLTDRRIRVVRLDRYDGDQTPVFAMVPMDGEWGSDV